MKKIIATLLLTACATLLHADYYGNYGYGGGTGCPSGRCAQCPFQQGPQGPYQQGPQGPYAQGQFYQGGQYMPQGGQYFQGPQGAYSQQGSSYQGQSQTRWYNPATWGSGSSYQGPQSQGSMYQGKEQSATGYQGGANFQGSSTYQGAPTQGYGPAATDNTQRSTSATPRSNY